MISQEQIDKCLSWLRDADISSYFDDGRLFVQIADADIEISEDEIKYRAELYDLSAEGDKEDE